MFYKIRKIYLCLIVIYAIIREVVPLNFLISNQYVSLTVLLLGFALVVWDLFCDKNILKTKNIVWLFVFLLIYIVSSILNFKYGYFDNFKTIGILFIFFFTLYSYGNVNNSDSFENDLVVVSIIYVLIMGVFLLLGLLMYIFDIGYIVEIYDVSDQGFSSGLSRLWGVFAEANCAAVYSSVTMVLSIWLYRKTVKKYFRIILVIDIVISYLFMVLALSRTAQLVAAICVFWIAFCILWFKTTSFSKVKRLVVLIFIPAIFATAIFGSVKITEKILPYVKYGIQLAPKYENVQMKIHRGFDFIYTDVGGINILVGMSPPNEVIDTPEYPKEPPKVVVLDRPDDNGNDVSHGRLDRWEQSLQIYKTAPIFGVTARNVNSYARENCPNNIFAKYNINVHNSYLEVLVGTGAIGMLVFLIFFVLSIIAVVKVIFSKYSLTNILLSSAMILVATAGFFHTDLFFIFRLGGVILWMILGYFALQSGRLEKKEN